MNHCTCLTIEWSRHNFRLGALIVRVVVSTTFIFGVPASVCMSRTRAHSVAGNEDVTILFPMETIRNVPTEHTFAVSFAVIKRTGRYLSAE